MFRDSITPENAARFLRLEAENRLRAGSAPGNSVPLDRDTLTLLYAMASDPRRSSDALRLLQELQVHQVELDLQRGQLESNEREMSRELALYRDLFALAPCAGLIVTPDGCILAANPAAAGLFGADETALVGRALVELLALPGRAAWRDLLAALSTGEPSGRCDVLAAIQGDDPAILGITATRSPAGDALLVFAARRESDTHDASRQRPSA